MTTVLTVEQLSKSYRRFKAVDALSFTLNEGDFVGFIGPNGAGKSTTMGCIAGVLNADAGKIRVGDVDVMEQTTEARKLISFVPQHLELFDYLTGLEYLQFIADLRGVETAARDEQIEDLMALTELTEARHRIVKEYSGGMARKLAICGALIGEPRLLLLDESFVGLDPESTYRIRQRLLKFCEGGGAILLSSHILDMLERICTRVVMLVDGQLKLDEPMEALREQFKSGPHEDLTTLYLHESGKIDTL